MSTNKEFGRSVDLKIIAEEAEKTRRQLEEVNRKLDKLVEFVDHASERALILHVTSLNRGLAELTAAVRAIAPPSEPGER